MTKKELIAKLQEDKQNYDAPVFVSIVDEAAPDSDPMLVDIDYVTADTEVYINITF